MAVKIFTDDNFKDETASGVILVDFWAEWCAPCRMIAPIVEELAGEMPNVSFGKLNVDENTNVAQSLGITAIPTLIIFKDGEVVDKVVGLLPKAQLKKVLEKYV